MASKMAEASRWYLTTPIYYASGEPHIGHAYTTILADALARFQRRDGSRVLYLTGTDEHGPKIAEEAQRRGLSPIELCDTMADRFKEAWVRLGISNDRFIRTTEDEHKEVVREFVQRLYDRGHIYGGTYSGWYCIHEERYWTEKDLGPGLSCPDCSRSVRHIEEKNYFFRMSAFQDALLDHIEKTPDWIVPSSRLNEIRGFLQKPLGDLSISRPKARVPWGIELPFDSEHVAYVWVDALINYLTGSGAIDASVPGGSRRFDDVRGSWWPCNLHVVGKDIITTHAVYWPTLLMGVGLPLPRQLLAHGWWVVGETKMSKSIGNVVDPLALAERFGADAVRWYLLREMPTGSDASYTTERFLTRYNELANILGNLASRTVSMVIRYRGGVVPDTPGTGLNREIDRTFGLVRRELARFRVHEALGASMHLARIANGYVESERPWELARNDGKAEALDEVLTSLVRGIVALCTLFEPVTPPAMSIRARRLGVELPTLDAVMGVELGGIKVSRLEPLFPKAGK